MLRNGTIRVSDTSITYFLNAPNVSAPADPASTPSVVPVPRQ
jgi:hypothetical protein